MKSATLLGISCLLLVLIFQTADAAVGRCNCSGRCGSFSCPDPMNTKGCNCVTCQCIRGNIGFRSCCASSCGFWNSRKCFRCKPWQGCSCNGCR